MMFPRKYFLLFIGIICYIYASQGWIILYALLSVVVIVTGKIQTRIPYLRHFAIIALLGGFILIKSLSTVTLIGYSVFAFSGISFIVDQYKSKKEYSSLDVLVYLLYFPKMLAGPIVRINPFTQQLNTQYISAISAYKGLKIIIFALSIKLLVADSILNVTVNSQGVNLLMQSLAWGVQFYLDFYAYSLLAVGVSLLAGITIPYNFNKPYLASSFHDFWKRWNITLSSWLKDYIYIPLGGSRRSNIKTYINVLLTFIMSGLWHGVTIPFILWGLCHGILVCLEHTLRTKRNNETCNLLYRVFVVFSAIMLWQLFRLHDIDDIRGYLHSLCHALPIDWAILPKVVIAFGVLCLLEWKGLQNLMLKYRSSRKYVICEVSILSFLLFILALLPFNYTFDFFYMKF